MKFFAKRNPIEVLLALRVPRQDFFFKNKKWRRGSPPSFFWHREKLDGHFFWNHNTKTQEKTRKIEKGFRKRGRGGRRRRKKRFFCKNKSHKDTLDIESTFEGIVFASKNQEECPRQTSFDVEKSLMGVFLQSHTTWTQRKRRGRMKKVSEKKMKRRKRKEEEEEGEEKKENEEENEEKKTIFFAKKILQGYSWH